MLQVVGGNEDCTDGEGGGADGDLAGGRLAGIKISPLDSTAPHDEALERDDEAAVASFVFCLRPALRRNLAGVPF